MDSSTLAESPPTMTYFDGPQASPSTTPMADTVIPPTPPRDTGHLLHLQIANPLKWIRKFRQGKLGGGIHHGTRPKTVSVDKNQHELFQIDNAIASIEDLHLEQIEDHNISEHVSCVWSADDLTSKQKQYIKAKGLKVSQLPNKLFVGDRHVACNRVRLNELNVEFIVNCTHSTPCLFEEEAGGVGDAHLDRFRYCRVPLSDDMQENLLIHLDDAHGFLNNCVSDEHFNAHSRNTLIHCSYGVSRSSSVCISWMMATLGMSLREAMAMVTARRQKARPNQCFMVQLMEFEAKLFGAENISVKEQDFEPCVVCLSESLTDAKSELRCGHVACQPCIDTGVRECTHCAFARQYSSSMTD